ncbi:DNA-directed RNA polymerase III subunit Rpc5 [Thamnidium elegans]|nr:DNA-directed RNA polymerase III subunit Rpc5 [Thamnidium elegans]
MSNNDDQVMEVEDEVLAEYPIYLTTELTKYLYMFQYPMRSTPFNGKNGPTAARLKPKAKMVELDIPLDTRSPNYSTERGEDFAMGLNDKTIKTAYDRRMEEHEEELTMGHNYRQPKKKEEELLDKMTLTSIEVPNQTKYVIGVIRDGELHLTPINTTVQLRPGFKYIDKIDEKWKAANKRIQDVEKQEEKKKGVDPNTAQTLQVSVKNAEREGNMRRNVYSMSVRNAEEEDWQPIVYYDETSLPAEKVSEKLYSATKEHLECKTTNAEYLDQLSGQKTTTF